MHSLMCVSVVVCVARKPRPCLSYSRRRDRINSVLLRSYYKGGGVGFGLGLGLFGPIQSHFTPFSSHPPPTPQHPPPPTHHTS